MGSMGGDHYIAYARHANTAVKKYKKQQQQQQQQQQQIPKRIFTSVNSILLFIHCAVYVVVNIFCATGSMVWIWW